MRTLTELIRDGVLVPLGDGVYRYVETPAPDPAGFLTPRTGRHVEAILGKGARIELAPGRRDLPAEALPVGWPRRDALEDDGPDFEAHDAALRSLREPVGAE